MLKKKIFIFDELNYLLLPLALFQKIFISEVYFIRLIKIWQNEKSIKFFEFIGLKWLNFQDYEIKRTAEISRNVVLLQNKFGDLMDSLNIAKELKGKLIKMGCNANDLKSFALTKVAIHLRQFCEIAIFLDHIRKDDKDNFVIVVSNRGVRKFCVVSSDELVRSSKVLLKFLFYGLLLFGWPIFCLGSSHRRNGIR